jgi:hypothetical protein
MRAATLAGAENLLSDSSPARPFLSALLFAKNSQNTKCFHKKHFVFAVSVASLSFLTSLFLLIAAFSPP